MGNFLQDLRYGLRMLAKNPGFTAVALLTLALAIAANTAIFSVLDAVLLRPLPYNDPHRLVVVYMRFTGIGLPKDQNAVSAPEFRDLQQFSKSFTSIAAVNSTSFNMGVGGRPERLQGAQVSPAFFSVLGAQPRLGRFFSPEEAQPGHDPTVILSNGLWKRAYGGDLSIVGKTIIVNERQTTVIGVMQPGFDFPSQTDLWAPLAFAPADLAPDNRGNHGYDVVARIRPELTLAQARSDMARVSQVIIDQNQNYPYTRFNFAVLLVPMLDDLVGDELHTALWVLMGAVAFVLLIACANVSSLMLARATSREREVAIRTALGAGTRRLLRQFLTESVMLALLGGALGLAAVPFILRVLTDLSATTLPRALDTTLSIPMLVFTALVAPGTGIAFGLLPAFRSARGVQYVALKEGGRGHSGGRHSNRNLRALVAAEAAISVILLMGAGLLLRSFLQVLKVDPGFRPEGVLTMRVSLPSEKYAKPEQLRAFFRDLVARVQQIPGVDAAGGTSLLPLSGGSNSGTVTMDSTAVPPDQRTPESDWRRVSPGYFQAMGIPLLEGRYIDEHDTDTAALVAVVDESVAKTYWPNESALGKRLHLGGNRRTGDSPPNWMTIVGVVKHVHNRTLEARSRTEVYWPYSQQFTISAMSLAVHTSGNPMGLAAATQRAVASLDPDLPVYRVRAMQEIMGESLAQRRLALVLLVLFAGVALLLAAAGIYATTSFYVTQRNQEMGVRTALGAARRDILVLVIRQGMTFTLIGLAAGVLGALLLAQFIRTMLFSVSIADPLAIAAGVVLLAGVALLACLIPAHRATRVDPMVALRYE